MAITAQTMRRVLQRLYPNGKIWEKTLSDDDFLETRAELFSEAYSFADGLLDEIDVRTANLKLDDYAAAYGVDISALTVGTAHKLLYLKKNAQFDPTPTNYARLLTQYGATGTVEESLPFVCGLSQTGGNDQCGDEDTVYMWFITIEGGDYTEFRCGESECGETLGEYDEGISELMSMIGKYAPAHGRLTIVLN